MRTYSPDPQISGGDLDNPANDDVTPVVTRPPTYIADQSALIAAIQANPTLMQQIQYDGAAFLRVASALSPILNVAVPGAGSGLALALGGVSAALGALPTV